MENLELKEYLYLLEERLLHPGVRKSVYELDVLLADDFVEFGGSGRTFDKQQTIDGLANEAIIQMTLRDFKVKQLAANVALTTFRVLKHEDMKVSLRSSIWKLKEDQWQMVFHQGTPTAERSELEG